MLSLNNLTCSYGDKVLFTKLSYTLGDCCLLIIRGANGSGKTSLLRIIATLLKPSEGEILYANESIDQEYHHEYCQMLNYIGDKPAQKDNLTVEENISFWAQINGNGELLVEAALQFFKLQDLRNVKLNKLSMGWKKRVQLTRLLLSPSSSIWLLDEPYNFLDEQGKYLLDGLIKSRIDQGGTVIIATNEDIKLSLQCCIDLADFCKKEED